MRSVNRKFAFSLSGSSAIEINRNQLLLDLDSECRIYYSKDIGAEYPRQMSGVRFWEGLKDFPRSESLPGGCIPGHKGYRTLKLATSACRLIKPQKSVPLPYTFLLNTS
jgi:hypothetical protein